METGMDVGLGELAPVDGASMVAWSEDKRKEFCGIFEDRSTAAGEILFLTACAVYESAKNRHFIPAAPGFRDKLFDNHNRRHNYRHEIGGRTHEELNQIAKDRAKSILDTLPASRDAVEVIDSETASKMRKKERLDEQLKELQEELEELPIEIKMSEMDQSMTLGQFREYVELEVEKRKKLVAKVQKVGGQARGLEQEISKKLYHGLPGLKDAVAKVITAHLERATFLSTTTRRVVEKVKFGDSAEAMTLLSTFEQDELKVSDGVRAEFAGALEALNLHAAKRSKKKALEKAQEGEAK